MLWNLIELREHLDNKIKFESKYKMSATFLRFAEVTKASGKSVSIRSNRTEEQSTLIIQ